jgi:hypothetical protein
MARRAAAEPDERARYHRRALALDPYALAAAEALAG